MSDAGKMLARVSGIHARIASEVPQLRRGMAWCVRCGRSVRVDAAKCLKAGWPLCCGQTMSIDSPEERRALIDAAVRLFGNLRCVRKARAALEARTINARAALAQEPEP